MTTKVVIPSFLSISARGGRLLRQSDGVRTLTFLYDHTGLAAVEHNGTKYVYVKDVQGNIVALLDTNGTPVVKYTCDSLRSRA